MLCRRVGLLRGKGLAVPITQGWCFNAPTSELRRFAVSMPKPTQKLLPVAGATRKKNLRFSTTAESDAAASKKADPGRWQYRYALRHRMVTAWKHNPKDQMVMEKAAAKLLRRPEKAAEMMADLPEDQRRAIALSWAMTELEEEFTKADKDLDGKLSYKEFKQWANNIIESGPTRDQVTPPTNRQYIYVTVGACVPFIGFGAVDNGLMVIYGDVIDGTLGMWFGFSMLASAALGNAISNIFGMTLHGTITKMADKLGLPDPHLTLTQRKLPRVHFWSTFGATVGVFSGCLLGMTPLLFMDQTKKEEERAAGKKHEEKKPEEKKTEEKP